MSLRNEKQAQSLRTVKKREVKAEGKKQIRLSKTATGKLTVVGALAVDE